MEFLDIRRGTDVEFGQSIYEPFGIAQLEPLTFGGLCVFSSVCGCSGFVKDAISGMSSAPGDGTRNIIVADYTTTNGEFHENGNFLEIDRNIRDQIEARVSSEVADEILMLLPRTETEMAAMIETGFQIARNMSWDVVVNNYLLPILGKMLKKQHFQNIQTVA
jgi:glycogen synthase